MGAPGPPGSCVPSLLPGLGRSLGGDGRDAVLGLLSRARSRRGTVDDEASRLRGDLGLGIFDRQITAEWWSRRDRFELLVSEAVLAKAAIDAAHVAIATVHGVNFLLTWNCAHVANAVMRERIEAVCRQAGFRPPLICTPEELMLQEDS